MKIERQTTLHLNAEDCESLELIMDTFMADLNHDPEGHAHKLAEQLWHDLTR